MAPENPAQKIARATAELDAIAARTGLYANADPAWIEAERAAWRRYLAAAIAEQSRKAF